MSIADRLSRSASHCEMTAVWLFSRLLIWFMIQRAGSDVPLFRQFAVRIASGELAYRDFPVDHPPLVLLFALIPLLFGALVDYVTIFRFLLFACDLGAFFLLQRITRDAKHMRAVLGLYVWLGAISFPILYERVDLLLVLLLTALLWFGVTKRFGWGYVSLFGCAMTNFGTMFLVPIWAIYDFHVSGHRIAARRILIFLAVYIGLVIAGTLLSGSGFVDSLRYHWGRGTQIESLAASLMILAHGLGMPLAVNGSSGIFVLIGAHSSILTAVLLVGGILTLTLILRIVRLRLRLVPMDSFSPTRWLTYGILTGLLAFLLISPVFLPQYTLWLYPFAALGLIYISQRKTWTILWIATAVYTTTVFPWNYESLFRLQLTGSTLMILRNAALIVLTVWGIRCWLSTGNTSQKKSE